MNTDQDPIVAIATAPGRGGVGIIRLSGSDTFIKDFLRSFFGSEDSFKPRYAHYRRFRDQNGEVIDDGLVIYFPSPRSYTGESAVELQAHGGPVVLKVLLSAVLRAGKVFGLRLAEPGEFTRRAFLNGRIDLSQAEAVADLIDATTEGAVRAASRSLVGVFSRKIHDISDQLIELRALIEAILDFPEEEIDFIKSTQARERLKNICMAFDQLMHQSQQGAILRDGVTVVLVGSPNVGKSSLMNVLSGNDVAIVTEVPGTTRDKIEYDIQIEGVSVRLIDTAGIRETDDKVESLGIERTLRAIEKADVVLYLQDLSTDDDAEGRKTLNRVLERTQKNVPILKVFNKCDIAKPNGLDRDALVISAKTGIGIDELKRKLLDLVGWENNPESLFLARERHLVALREAGSHLLIAENLVATSEPQLDLLAEELRLANENLGEIVGITTPDDILGMIFSRFCIDK